MSPKWVIGMPGGSKKLCWVLFRSNLVAQFVECLLRGTEGHGFDPGPRHTKVIKNGTSCFSLGTQTYRIELGQVNPMSG